MKGKLPRHESNAENADDNASSDGESNSDSSRFALAIAHTHIDIVVCEKEPKVAMRVPLVSTVHEDSIAKAESTGNDEASSDGKNASAYLSNHSKENSNSSKFATAMAPTDVVVCRNAEESSEEVSIVVLDDNTSNNALLCSKNASKNSDSSKFATAIAPTDVVVCKNADLQGDGESEESSNPSEFTLAIAHTHMLMLWGAGKSQK